MRKFPAGMFFGIATPTTIWAAAALSFDFPVAALRWPFAAAYLAAIAILLVATRASRRALEIWIASLLLVVAGWFTLKPTNDRDWQRDVDRVAWADINGGRATIHNIATSTTSPKPTSLPIGKRAPSTSRPSAEWIYSSATGARR